MKARADSNIFERPSAEKLVEMNNWRYFAKAKGQLTKLLRLEGLHKLLLLNSTIFSEDKMQLSRIHSAYKNEFIYNKDVEYVCY